MYDVIDIIMKRDGCAEDEAYALVKDCQEEMEIAISEGRYYECEDIIADWLGLEPDYMLDVMEIV